ncbi:hypothetical protein ACFV8T_33185 [Streptomyces sp. NPDC059832]|uniref:hypothetical protein n=1 Tax=unclassified Streptomyces TaxID=2593676 RepID=UPI003648E005
MVEFDAWPLLEAAAAAPVPERQHLDEHAAASFDPEEADLEAIEDRLGVRPPVSNRVEASRAYDGHLVVGISCDLEHVLDAVVEDIGTDYLDDLKFVKQTESVAGLVTAAKARAKRHS